MLSLHHPAIQSLPAAVQYRAAQVARPMALPDGGMLKRTGCVPDGVHWVCKGLVKVQRDAPGEGLRVLTFLRPGFWCGVGPVIEQRLAHYDFVSCGTSHVVLLPAAHFLAMRDECDALRTASDGWERRYAQRMAGLLDESLALAPAKLLARRVLELAQWCDEGRATVRLPLTQTDLGALTGVTRQRINQLLGVWRAQGIASAAYGCVDVHDMDALAGLAGAQGLAAWKPETARVASLA